MLFFISESFRTFFSQFGELEDCIVMRDRLSSRSRGFGFVTYSNRESTEKALAATGTDLDGRKIDIKLAIPREQMDTIER